MSKNSSAKYYQSNEKRLQRKVSERYQSLSKVKKKRKKSDNMVVNDTEIYQKMKNKTLLSIQTNIIKWEKRFVIIIRNYYLKK